VEIDCYYSDLTDIFRILIVVVMDVVVENRIDIRGSGNEGAKRKIGDKRDLGWWIH